MKPEIIVRIPLPAAGLRLLAQDFVVHHVPTPPAFEQAIDAYPETRALVTNAMWGVSEAQLRRLPKLEFVQTRGVGNDGVDIDAVRALGLVLASGKGTNAFAVADHAMALLLGAVRNLCNLNTAVRAGQWEAMRGPRPVIWKKTLGILGLGEIGAMVARRAQGFDMDVIYHNRRPREDVPYRYVASALELAHASDHVVIAMPGSADTRGMIGREFLDALGPDGFLVNVGRGSLVDSEQLALALSEGRIAGAGLDVVDGEPEVPDCLLRAPNLVITPHMGARAPETEQAAITRIHDNLLAHFAGRPLLGQIV